MKSVSVIRARKPAETSKIFEKREGQKHTEYRYYPQNDTAQIQLDEYVSQYRRDDSLRNKKKIIEAEKAILLEELQEPELALIHLHKDLIKDIEGNTPRNEFINWLRLCIANGFYRIISLPSQIAPRFTNRDCQIIKRVFGDIDENDEFGMLAKGELINILRWKDKANLVKGLTKNPKLIKGIDTATYNIGEIAKKVRNNTYNSEELEIFLTHKYEDEKEIKRIKSDIIRILKDKKIPHRKKQLAVWGAGIFKSEEAYKILKKIAVNKDEKDIILREYALHSLAFYIRRHPDEVKKIIGRVVKENSIFSPLAKILKSKLEGKYHSTRNRPFIERGMTEEDIKKFLGIRKKIIDKKSSPLNIMEENKLNESLLEYERPLTELFRKKFKIGITDETATKLLKEFAGKRIFYRLFGKNQGDFEDSITGRASYTPTPYVLLSRISLARNYINVTKHELAHQLQMGILSPEENLKLNELYQRAITRKHSGYNYSITNKNEYFACTMDEFLSPYRAHEELLNYNSSKYHLMVKNRMMYNFLQKIYKKYFEGQTTIK